VYTLINKRNKLYLLNLIKIIDLQEIPVMFITRVSILNEHMQQIDLSIKKVPINMLYDVQQVTTPFYTQTVHLIVFVLMAMEHCDQMSIVHMMT
jgi:hypothetical protein